MSSPALPTTLRLKKSFGPLSSELSDNEYSGVLSDLKESVRFTANGEDYYTPYKTITLVPPPGLIELTCDEERPAYLYHRRPAGSSPADLKGKKEVFKDLPVSLASTVSSIDVAAGTNVVLRGKTDKQLRDREQGVIRVELERLKRIQKMESGKHAITCSAS